MVYKNKGPFQATRTKKKVLREKYVCKSLTPAERKWAAPKRRVSKDAFNCNLTDEFITLVADKSERLPRQVKPLRQDLVAVVRDTRVFTGNRILR